MFQWYRDAEVCHAWLADLRTEDSSNALSLQSCRWFTRGWTLQELIAPRKVEFYDQSWTFRGTKSDLKDALLKVTGIDGEALENPGILYRIPVAQRMSWAAARQTTRIEDMAYCLLGIFDINMPMLYGEGSRAFLRLQEHIVKEVNDLSIFAWKTTKDQTYQGLFAEDLSAFSESSSIYIHEDMSFSPDFTITNKGLRIEAAMKASVDSGGYLMKLNCAQKLNDGSKKPVGIYLSQHAGGIYSRTRASEYAPVEDQDTPFQSQAIFILKHVTAQRSIDLQQSHQSAFSFRTNFNREGGAPPFPNFPFAAKAITPSQHWDAQRCMFLTHGASEFTACIEFERRETSGIGKNVFPGQWFLVVIGLAEGETKPWITVAGMNDSGPALIGLRDNLKALAIYGRKGRSQMETTVEGMALDASGIPTGMAPVGKVSVSIDEDVINGQSVYCIDLDYKGISASKRSKNDKKSRIRQFDERSI